MTTDELKQEIENKIYDNDKQDIKGQTLQAVLTDMLNNEDVINRFSFVGSNENEIVVVGTSGLLQSSKITIDEAKGIQGPTGATGVTGPQGYQGTTGPTGIQGATGVQGITGMRGYKGDQGPTGPMGPIGPRGIQGPAGEGGISVVGPTGPTGPKGDRGANGDKGEKGDPGSVVEYKQIYPVKTILLGEIIIDGVSNKIYSPMIINSVEHKTTYTLSSEDEQFLKTFITKKKCVSTFDETNFISKDILDNCIISHDDYSLVIDRTDLYKNYYMYYHITECGGKDVLDIYDKTISKQFNSDEINYILFNSKQSFVVLCYTDTQIGLFDITEKIITK